MAGILNCLIRQFEDVSYLPLVHLPPIAGAWQLIDDDLARLSDFQFDSIALQSRLQTQVALQVIYFRLTSQELREISRL